jgi:hypothetical protein
MSCLRFSARIKESLSSWEPRPIAEEEEEVVVGTPHCFEGALVFRVVAELMEGLRRRGEDVGFEEAGEVVSRSEAMPCMADHESPKKADKVAGDWARPGFSRLILVTWRRV